MLLGVAQDAVSHVEAVERLLAKLGNPRELPPSKRIRDQLREARNLLAVHRDERVLYWRLTGEHTPHVVKTYRRLGVELPVGTIDKEIIAYGPPPGATEDEIEAGYAGIGTCIFGNSVCSWFRSARRCTMLQMIGPSGKVITPSGRWNHRRAMARFLSGERCPSGFSGSSPVDPCPPFT